MSRIAYVSTYLPKRCGLATYTYHLKQSVKDAKGWYANDPVIALVDTEEQTEMHDRGYWPLLKESREAYVKMAEKINASTVSAVSLQHEFGIFGGEAGEYVLELIRRLKKPLITTFHTVFEHPQQPYYSIQKEIAEHSDRIIVMNRKAIGYLEKSFGIDRGKISFIPHGTPQPDGKDRDLLKERLGWSGKKVMMTFGLLSRGKGIESIIEVLPQVVRNVPDVVYAIVGQTHPEVKKREGEAYREQLLAMIAERGLQDHVIMVDRYLEEADLIQYITACDLYVTPYPGMQQITSGTLAYAVGLGRAVLTTPYSYAQDLLQGYEQLLIPYGQPQLWADKICELLAQPDVLRRWENALAEIGKTMHWSRVGKQHAQLFSNVIDAHGAGLSGGKSFDRIGEAQLAASRH